MRSAPPGMNDGAKPGGMEGAKNNRHQAIHISAVHGTKADVDRLGSFFDETDEGIGRLRKIILFAEPESAHMDIARPVRRTGKHVGTDGIERDGGKMWG